MVEVVVTDEFVNWYENLDEEDSDAVHRIIDLLEARGVTLGHPYSSALLNCQYALRELRIQSRGRPLRVAYGFDPKRQAVVLLGGNKDGDDRFYEWFIPQAEGLWKDYLEETGQ